MRTLVGAVALTLLLAGCGGTSPKPSPVVESSASATPPPSGPPSMPAEAQGTTAESAKAFVRHYFDLLSYASNTGDTSPLLAVGAADCESCGLVVRGIEKVYDAGGGASGASYACTNERATPIASGMRVRLSYRASEQFISEASGSPSATVAPETTEARFELVEDAGTWRIAQWTRL